MNRKTGNENTLRARAEAKLAAAEERRADTAERDPIALVHELQVHQIELEMQNEELRRAKEEAEEEHRRYQDLYDFAPVGYLTLDHVGKVTEANLAAASLLGCERHRLVGQPLFMFLAPESREEYETCIRRLLAGAAGVRCEVRLGANARRQGWLLLEGGTFDGETLQLGRLALIDVTERKMADEALRKSEEKFSRIFHAAPILIGISTLAEGRFVDVNAAGLQILGYRRDEIIGRTSHELGLWANPSDRAKVVRIAEEQGSVRNFQMRFRVKSGLTHIGLFSADLIDLEGERYLLSVVKDVTERKQAEEKIELLNTELAARAAELGAANLELEAFNYSVSHDLRIPLTSIGGYCQIIQEFCGNSLDEQCRGYLREIDEGVQRMSQLIDALLALSRLAHVEPQRETVDLTALAKAVALDLRLNLPERRVIFHIANCVTVEGDPKLLRVVLENLLGNAWKYTNEKEEAIIEFGIVEVEGKPACFVRDNGAGFDMAHADKLFIPFQRLPGTDAFKGHGIGLATVQRIILRHGGRIWAEGEPGKGATFYFTLPAIGF